LGRGGARALRAELRHPQSMAGPPPKTRRGYQSGRCRRQSLRFHRSGRVLPGDGGRLHGIPRRGFEPLALARGLHPAGD